MLYSVKHDSYMADKRNKNINIRVSPEERERVTELVRSLQDGSGADASKLLRDLLGLTNNGIAANGFFGLDDSVFTFRMNPSLGRVLGDIARIEGRSIGQVVELVLWGGFLRYLATHRLTTPLEVKSLEPIAQAELVDNFHEYSAFGEMDNTSMMPLKPANKTEIDGDENEVPGPALGIGLDDMTPEWIEGRPHNRQPKRKDKKTGS